jgi:hypothetical protein
VLLLGCSLQAQVYVPQDNRHILWKVLEKRARLEGLRLFQQQTQFDYGHSLRETEPPKARILPPSRFGGELSGIGTPSDMLIDNRFLAIDDALKIRVSLHDIFGVVTNNPDQDQGISCGHEPWWRRVKADTSADVKLNTDIVKSYKIRFRYLFESSEIYFGFNYFPVREDETVAGFSLTF